MVDFGYIPYDRKGKIFCVFFASLRFCRRFFWFPVVRAEFFLNFSIDAGADKMAKLTIQLNESDYQSLLKAASSRGRSIQDLILEFITQLTGADSAYDVTQDPIYQMDGYDSNAPSDLSIHADKYIYGDDDLK